jgi:hypothetical protein
MLYLTEVLVPLHHSRITTHKMLLISLPNLYRRNCFLPRLVIHLLVGTGVTRTLGAFVGEGDGFTVVQYAEPVPQYPHCEQQ